MKLNPHFRKSVISAFILIAVLGSAQPNTTSAGPLLQSGGPASRGRGPKGPGVAGVAISTRDKLTPRATVPDPRPFSVRHAIDEAEFARLKHDAKTSSLAPISGGFTQQDPAVAKRTSQPLAPTPLSNNWQGIGPTAYQPPDPVIAVGVDHVVTVVNASWVIYDKSGNQLYTSRLNEWFANVTLSGTFLTDPKVLYDQHSNRWVLMILAVYQSTNQSWWLVSVSQQSSAIGAWWNYAFDATLNGSTPTNNWADFPGLGVDNQAIYLTANMYSFPFRTGPFQYAKVRILNKSVLYSGGAAGWWDFWNLQNPSGGTADTVQPAHTYGTPGVEYLVNSYSGSGTSLTLWALNNPLGTPSLSSFTINVSSYSIPPDAEQPGGTTTRIATNDARLLNAVYRLGSLWTAHTINYNWGTGNRAALRMYEINPTMASLWNQVTFGATDLYYYFPTIMADASGDAALVFSRSGTTEYASIRYTGRLTTDPGLQASAQLKAGEAAYTGGSWGDYSGIALDPNGQWFWMFHEYAAFDFLLGGVWRTWVGAASFGNVSPCYYLATAASPSGSGSVSPSPAPNCNGGTQYTVGTNVTLTANANLGYTFSNWGGDASGSSNPTVITMNGNRSVIANFTLQPPSTPSNPNPSDGATVDRTTNIALFWSTSGADQCYVHLWGGPGIDINSGWAGCSGWSIGQQWPGSYQWQVSARNSSGTTTGPIWHLYIRPYAPTNLSASAVSSSQINLSWTKSSDDPGSVDSYNVYYSNGTLIIALPAGSTSYMVSGLSCGTSYSFYVIAIRQGVESTPSNAANVSTQGCSSTVSVISVWTTDGNSAAKSIFNPSDSIRYYGDIYNTAGITQTAFFVWSVNGPCGSIASWSGNLSTGAGHAWWYLPGNIPTNACGGTYTYQLGVTYNASTTSQSTLFTVNQTGTRIYLPIILR